MSNLRNRMRPGKPKYMIVYLCGTCGFEFGRTELHKPVCSYCQAKTGIGIVKKVPISPEAIAERLKVATDNMQRALMSAYQSRPAEVDETQLLKVMSKAKKFVDEVQAVPLKKSHQRIRRKLIAKSKR